MASCRVLEAEPDAYEGDDSTVVAISDAANGAAVPQEEAASGSAAEAATRTVAADGEGSLIRLPSHRRRRPCRHGFLHRHFLWARRHGLSGRRGAFAGPGEARPQSGNGEERRELDQEEELKAVAEPDPDLRRPADADGEQEFDAMKAVAEPGPDSRPESDTDGEQESEAVTAWKGEMVRKFRHGLRFRRHHHEEEEATRTRFFHHRRDSENEVDEVEELARRLSRAILRRSFHGRRHHHHHHHAEEAVKEEGGVKKWFKGLVNRF